MPARHTGEEVCGRGSRSLLELRGRGRGRGRVRNDGGHDRDSKEA